MSQLPQCLWAPNLLGSWYTMRSHHFGSDMMLWQKTCGHQIREGVDIPLGLSTIKSCNLLSYNTCPGEVMWQIKNIQSPPLQYLYLPNLSVSYILLESPTCLVKWSLITWFCEVLLQIRYVILPLVEGLWAPNYARWCITTRGSYS